MMNSKYLLAVLFFAGNNLAMNKCENHEPVKRRTKVQKINFTPHALERMNERGISRGEVEKAIKFGSRSVEKDGIIYKRKNLTVVMSPNSYTIITVYKN